MGQALQALAARGCRWHCSVRDWSWIGTTAKWAEHCNCRTLAAGNDSSKKVAVKETESAATQDDLCESQLERTQWFAFTGEASLSA